MTSAFPQVRTAGRPGVHSASGVIGSGSGLLNAYAVSGSVSLLARPVEDFSEAPETQAAEAEAPEAEAPEAEAAEGDGEPR